jgi:hypothetical protein
VKLKTVRFDGMVPMPDGDERVAVLDVVDGWDLERLEDARILARHPERGEMAFDGYAYSYVALPVPAPLPEPGPPTGKRRRA